MQYAKKVMQVIEYGKDVSSKVPEMNLETKRSRGSGFFVRLFDDEKKSTPPRYIITAAHVVKIAFLNSGVKIVLPLVGREEIPVKVVAIVPQIDLAILDLSAPLAEKYKDFIEAFPVGNDHDLEFGGSEPILILGYPLGQEQLKVLRCNFTGRQGIGIQTDCAVNGGNSGGPLIYKDKVMGWVSTGVNPSDAHNINWAVPINQFTAILPRIRERVSEGSQRVSEGSQRVSEGSQRVSEGSQRVSEGSQMVSENSRFQLVSTGSRTEGGGGSVIVNMPSLGVMYHNSTPVINNRQCEGFVIYFVSKYSVLSDIVNPGDKLCSIEYNNQVYKLDQRGEVSVPWYFSKLPFNQIVAEIPEGTKVTFNIWDSKSHQYKHKTIALNFPGKNGYYEQQLRYEPLDFEQFAGLTIMPLRANHLEDFPQLRLSLLPTEREEEMLVITNVVPGSEVADSGAIMPSDILETVNDKSVRTMKELRQALQHPFIVNSTKVIKFVTRDRASVVLNLQDVMAKEQIYHEQSGGVQKGQPATATFENLNKLYGQ